MKAEIWRGTLKGVKIGFLTGLCLAALYVVIGVVGETELTKSLGFSLLLVGFPTLFAIVPALQWLGVQGGSREGVLILVLTLSLNGALWARSSAPQSPWDRSGIGNESGRSLKWDAA